jgi:hypothetical protein
VKLDLEANTLIWPNGADFDPAILHDWPQRSADIGSPFVQECATEMHTSAAFAAIWEKR